MTVAEQFLMISTRLPTRYLYGIGENPHESFVHDMNYRMWPIFARDQPPGDVGALFFVLDVVATNMSLIFHLPTTTRVK